MLGSRAQATCSTIPYQRNHGFFGREDQLREMDEAFQDKSSSPKIQTVAIWGTGGIGKSQLALEYAHRRWNSGTSVVLWISSETEGGVAKSVREAAEKLQLDDYSETNTPDKNRLLLIQWLQTTKTKWLLIFDNVEDDKVLINNRPTVGSGDVLITCRSEPLAESIAMFPIEVTTFSTQESTSLIFQILNRTALNSEETQAADALAERLGGLALAIEIIAKNIKASRRFKSIEEFLPYYEEHCVALRKRHRRGICDLTYSKDIDTVWETVFATINPEANPDANTDAIRLMEILCFVAPEAIPQSLFQGDEKDFPGNDIIYSLPRFEEAKADLLDLSLIRINSETRLISIHRLVQQAYFDQMTTESRKDALNVTFSLLRKAFPDRKGETHLFNRWGICEQFHQHVQALRKMNISMKDGELILDRSGYQTLIRDDIWYMLEQQQFIGAETLMQNQLSNMDDSSLEYAHMNRMLMGLFERTGRSIKALKCAKLEFDIFVAHNGPEENDLANAYSDMGYSCCSAFKPQEALGYLDRAVDIALSHPEPECYRNFNIDRFLRNRGRTKAQLGDYDGSLNDFSRAEYYQGRIHGENSHYDGEAKYERAKIAATQGRLEEAILMNQQALELMRRGKSTHSSVGASHYRQGCLLLLRGRYDAALEEFERAHAICQLNESTRGNAGESARIIWRMAQIYEHDQKVDEAQTFLATAKKIRDDLLSTGDYAHVKSDEDSWDSLVGLLYR
ncbi:P-loop containing nucleoside triphosphate hydrolase protein [Nemania sp. NC0429]|nr:P-loop containing nucleoside triphosphate hydrolase protein [Nemania sp. NC0429]